MGYASRCMSVRISGGGSRGVLQVNLDSGGWDAVCDDGFSTAEATVFCRELGFAEGQVSRRWTSLSTSL